MNGPPIFSILHASARPDKWREAHDAWLKACTNPGHVEYILAVDEADDTAFDTVVGDVGFWPASQNWHSLKFVTNHKRRCNVDAWNEAARQSAGHVLIVVSDDQFPCERWDEKLLLVMPTKQQPDTCEVVPHGDGYEFAPVKHESSVLDFDRPFFIDVRTGNHMPRRLFEMPILSRKWYQKQGYVFYPEFLSMFADNDLFEEAQFEKVPIINARHLLFEHRHPYFDHNIPMDDVYRHTNRKEAIDAGEVIFKRRQQERAATPEPISGANPRKVVHLLLPGESFSRFWVQNLTVIIGGLNSKGYACVPHFGHCSCVSTTRNGMAVQVKELAVSPNDLVLWIDDDNLVSYPQALKLLRELESHPEADMVAGWTWIQSDLLPLDAQASCGVFDEEGNIKKIASFTIDGEPELFEIEWSGFPVVAMRLDAIKKAGRNCFTPLPTKDPASSFGLYGEDISFCLRLRQAGGRIFVDPTVYVPHLKLREALPSAAPVPMMNLDAETCGSHPPPRASTAAWPFPECVSTVPEMKVNLDRLFTDVRAAPV